MNALPKKKKNLRRIRILIRDSVPSSVVCERLKKARKERVQELILRRHTVDAALAGALQDLLISQDSWDYIEWNASSRIVLRLLKTLSSSSPSSKVVHRLVIIQPTDGIVTWLGTNTFQEMTMDSLSLQSATLSVGPTKAFSEGLSSKNCSLQRLDLRRSFFTCLQAIIELGKGVRNHRQLQELSIRHCHLEDHQIAILMGYMYCTVLYCMYFSNRPYPILGISSRIQNARIQTGGQPNNMHPTKNHNDLHTPFVEVSAVCK
jgi:hypothetical protein